MRIERKLFFVADIFLRDEAIDAESVRMLSVLKKDLELWLIVDSSRDLFEKMPDSGSLLKWFHKTVYLNEHGLNYGTPELFNFLINEAGAPQEQCLILDSNLKHAVLALKHRLPAAVIIDSCRLEREFLLRQLSAQPYVMHVRPA